MTDKTKQRIVKLCEGAEGKKGIGWPSSRCWNGTLETTRRQWRDFMDVRASLFVRQEKEASIIRYIEGKLVALGNVEILIQPFGTIVQVYGDNGLPEEISNNKDHLEALLDAAEIVLK